MKQNILIQIQGAKPKLMHCKDCLVLATNEDGQLQMHVNPGASLDVLYQMVYTFLPRLMEAAAKMPPDASEEEIYKQREAVYDHTNLLSSSLLKNFMPDKALRPDLDEEAILRAENEILEETYEAASPELKDEVKASIEETKESLKRKIKTDASESDVDQKEVDSVD